ncbi:hypothetical protein [Denitromonas iodatirespirans]|uniref:DUF3108 domain-containing protein n=1 Tax=Denitromonas iodatirespirans TaxID=2795389 RepID=A0A944HDX6_DENI1|nr:hypothetical protein [Denitromonas iodatirespirans]MBT0964192.1 hypothetical protein [Denitromonas iodatirespirans]
MTSAAQRVRHHLSVLLFGLLPALSANAACQLPDWPSDKAVQAPAPAPGTRWVYAGGQEFPPTQLRLVGIDDGVSAYHVNDTLELRETQATYTEVNPSRRGEQVWLRFPLALNDSWQDDFREEGEYQSPYEHYFYDYHESATSHVAAVEEITVAAGTFKALRIDRVARWTKENPRAADEARAGRVFTATAPVVSGVTLTQLWYVPPIGRVALKAQMRVGDGYYARLSSGLLDRRNAAIIELRAFERNEIHCEDVPVRLARQPEMYMPQGFPAQQNDSWEWAFQMRNHHPRRPR